MTGHYGRIAAATAVLVTVGISNAPAQTNAPAEPGAAAARPAEQPPAAAPDAVKPGSDKIVDRPSGISVVVDQDRKTITAVNEKDQIMWRHVMPPGAPITSVSIENGQIVTSPEKWVLDLQTGRVLEKR